MLSCHDHAERIAAAGRSRALRGQVRSAGIAAPLAARRVWMSNPTVLVKATDPLGFTPTPRPEEALSP